MKKNLIITVVVIMIAIIIILAVTFMPKQKNIKDENLKIVTSFYPIYIMTTNITKGAQNVDVMNLTQNNVGCLHDYTLSTQDMKKLENAQILIQNGLGLENFIDKIVSEHSNLKIIDTSTEIVDKIEENNEINPHIWTSIENYIKQVETIYKNLCEYNNENEEIYTSNYERYLNDLNELKNEYNTQLQKLQGEKVICLNEALTYLAKSLEMEVTEVTTNHEESTMSAETIKNVIEKMKTENIKIIFIGSQDDKKNAQTLVNETGAKIYELEDGLTGDLNNDAYLTKMNKNLETLKQIIVEGN